MKMKATEGQIAFLKGYGIDAPTERGICSRFIGFIKENNGRGAATPNERAAELRAAQQKYEGKKIRLLKNSFETVVTRVFPKNEAEVLNEKRSHSEVGQTFPFLISYTIVDGSRKKGVYGCISSVVLLE